VAKGLRGWLKGVTLRVANVVRVWGFGSDRWGVEKKEGHVLGFAKTYESRKRDRWLDVVRIRFS
jgi:hypothetical protein